MTENKDNKLIADGGISIGTFDDIMQPNEQPIDRNPRIECHVKACKNEPTWNEWKGIYDEITPETKMQCNECIGVLQEKARVEWRREQNKQLTEWC